MYRAIEELSDWLQAKEISDREWPLNSSTSCLKWHKPGTGWFKCNIDTTLYAGRCLVGLGMVVRDDMRAFVLARFVRLKVHSQ